MRFFSKISIVIAFSALITACKKDDGLNVADDLLGLGGDTWTQTSVDTWLYDNLTKPYNISVKYKWDQFEYDISRTLVPPDEAKIVPMWNVLKKVWIDPYIAEAGNTFFNKYAPKNFILAGSNSYNDDGSVILGTAEGGRKIVLYAVNNFRVKGMDGYNAANDSSFVKTWFLQTIHHEFGHILHQNIMYSQDFKKINPLLYQGNNWINITNREANRDGFVTAYATSKFDDDFVETLAILLLEGKQGYDNLINSIPDGTSENGTTKAQAQNYLRQKEAFVVNYFKQVWSVDFYSLQTRCREALSEFL